MMLMRQYFFPFFGRFGDRITFAVVIQGAFLVITSMLLDGGVMLQFMCLPAIAYWCTVAAIMVRREATRCDRGLLRWGFLLWIVAFVVALAGLDAMGILPDIRY